MIKNILLQCKFFLVEFLNVTYPLIPNQLRNFYLRMYGIRVYGGHPVYIEDVNSFM